MAEILAALMKAPCTRLQVVEYLGLKTDSGAVASNTQRALDALHKEGVIRICAFNKTLNGRFAQPVYRAQTSLFGEPDAKCPWPTKTIKGARWALDIDSVL